MSALLALVLAASDLAPPPAVETPEPRPGELAEAPDDLVAQLSFATLSVANGVWVGLNACAIVTCFGFSGEGALLSGTVGAGAGLGVAYFSWGLAREWGRAALLDSGMVASAIGGVWLASRHFVPSPELRYLLAAGIDAAGTAGFLVLASRVAPRPEAVWLADSLALWGAFVGSLLTGLVQAPEGEPANLVLFGAAGGGLVGAMLAASASRMSAVRFWAANGMALLGGLVLGGGLLFIEGLRTSGTLGFDPAIPKVGAAAGVAGGFLVGFALTESY